MAVERRPNVVEGTIIQTARDMVILRAVGSALMAVAAAVVLWDTWSHQEGEYLLPFHLAKDSLFTSFVVLLCFVGGTGCAIGFGWQSLFPHRLIFGEELLQVVRMGIAGPTVTTQVPFANIARVTCAQEPGGFEQLQVGIDLHRPDAPGMYPCDEAVVKKPEDIRDVYLPGFFTEGPEEIARRIVERCQV